MTPRRRPKGGANVAVAEPLVNDLADAPETQRFVEVREVSRGSRLITVIEVLSPSNKRPGEGQEQYLRKQQELRDAGVNLVEIALLRDGDWVVAVPRGAIDPNLRTPYRVVVRRGVEVSRGRVLRRLRSPIGCRQSRFRSGRPMQTSRSTCRLYSTSAKRTAATTTSITTQRRSRHYLTPRRWAAQLLRRTGAARSEA